MDDPYVPPGEKVSQRATPSKPKRLRFTLYADIDPAPRKVYLVSKFLGMGEMSCFYAGPGSAKSLLATDCGFHVAAGFPWFGRQVRQGAVLYVAAERAKLVERRLAALRKHYDVPDLPFAVVSGCVDFRSSEEHAQEVIGYARDLREISGLDVVLIIVDTVSRVLAGGDENSPKDMGALVTTISMIQDATTAHVMLIHHTPKDNATMRGHGALLGAVDTSVSIERAGVIRSATIVKDNDGAEGERLAFTIEGVHLSTDPETGEPTEAPVVIPSEASPMTSAPKETKATIPAAQRLLMTLIQQTLGDGPEQIRPFGPSGPTVDAVRMSAVRQRYYLRLPDDADQGEDPKTIRERKKKAFERAVRTAVEAERLIAKDYDDRKYLWLP